MSSDPGGFRRFADRVALALGYAMLGVVLVGFAWLLVVLGGCLVKL